MYLSVKHQLTVSRMLSVFSNAEAWPQPASPVVTSATNPVTPEVRILPLISEFIHNTWCHLEKPGEPRPFSSACGLSSLPVWGQFKKQKPVWLQHHGNHYHRLQSFTARRRQRPSHDALVAPMQSRSSYLSRDNNKDQSDLWVTSAPLSFIIISAQ